MFLLLVTDLTTSPKHVSSNSSISSPNVSFITWAPVTIAKSSIVSSFVGPKPGKSIKLTFILPFTLLVNNAAFGCCSTSPIINKGLLPLIQYSNMFCIFLILGIGDEEISIAGFSNVHVPLSLSVINLYNFLEFILLFLSANILNNL